MFFWLSAMREFNLSSWVRLIYLKDSKMLLLQPTWLSKIRSLFSKLNQMSLLIWRLKLDKPELRHLSWLITLKLKWIPLWKPIWPIKRLTCKLQLQKQMPTNTWRSTCRSRLTNSSWATLEWKLSIDSTLTTPKLVSFDYLLGSLKFIKIKR